MAVQMFANGHAFVWLVTIFKLPNYIGWGQRGGGVNRYGGKQGGFAESRKVVLTVQTGPNATNNLGIRCVVDQVNVPSGPMMHF